jgi:transcriptional regulator with PAS, ATPase and Fis domain
MNNNSNKIQFKGEEAYPATVRASKQNISWDELCTIYKKNWHENIEDYVLIKYGWRPEEVLLGNSKEIKTAFTMLQKVAHTDAVVLVNGESGTGKEGCAVAIHLLSPRREHKFITVDCISIPDGLIEGELFGHKKGAFTGADREYEGSFKLADGGTLFLDNINYMPFHLQPKIMRSIEQKQICRLHAKTPIPVNIRIVAATNINLEDMVTRGDFHYDLYYRISTFPIYLPPLRKRPQDILPLARFFITLFSLQQNKQPIKNLSPGCKDTLQQYKWPGNIRELRNRIQRAVTLIDEDEILPEHVFHGSAPPLQCQSSTDNSLELDIRRALDLGSTADTYVERLLDLMSPLNGELPSSRQISEVLNVSIHQAQIYLKRLKICRGLSN